MRVLTNNCKRLLTAYGWLFLATGAAFIALPDLVLGVMNSVSSWLPGARPFVLGGRTLWLGLTGSMMATIAFLALAAGRNPGRGSAWDAVLLSKAVSTGLFVLFAATERNSLFLIGAAVDGAILAHLLRLRLSAEAGGVLDPWKPRLGGRGYEVYFLKLNDPRTRDALWVRYTVSRGKNGLEAACWYVLFDAAKGKVLQGRWEENPSGVELDVPGLICRLGESRLSRERAVGAGPDARWELSWTPARTPAFWLVTEILHRLGIAGTAYCSPLSLGRFNGTARIQGATYPFSDAPGSVGHLWGRRMGDNWRWAHAVFPGTGEGETVFEILSAQGRLGPWRTPKFTLGCLWHKGRLLLSNSLLEGLRNETFETETGWGFRARFGELAAEGECVSPPDMTAEVGYTDLDGRRLTCRNSKTGTVRLKLSDGHGKVVDELEISDTAAVETVGPAE